MKAIILNSGLGSRLGDLTKDLPKCLLKIERNKTILGRQLSLLEELEVSDIILTTGHGADHIKTFIDTHHHHLTVKYIYNDQYAVTNYIYSLFLLQAEFSRDPSDVLLLHGDLVFDKAVLERLLHYQHSNAIIANYSYMNDKDFTGKISQGIIQKIAVGLSGPGCCFVAPFYKLSAASFVLWLQEIEKEVRKGAVTVYAEAALAEIYDTIRLVPVDTSGLWCQEVDNYEDLLAVRQYLARKL